MRTMELWIFWGKTERLKGFTLRPQLSSQKNNIIALQCFNILFLSIELLQNEKALKESRFLSCFVAI